MLISTNVSNTTIKNGATGLELDSVTVVVIFRDDIDYFGGQIRLTKDTDNISLSSTTEDLSKLAVEKAKEKIANATTEQPEPTTMEGKNE